MALRGGSGRLWSYAANRQRNAGSRRVLAPAIWHYWPILPRGSSPVVAIAVRWIVAAAMIAITLAAAPFQLDAAVITGSTLERWNDVAELHFIVKGRGLGWRLTTHGQEIWIDLSHVRMELPPRPLLGAEQSPIASVRTIDDNLAGRRGLSMQVIGRGGLREYLQHSAISWCSGWPRPAHRTISRRPSWLEPNAIPAGRGQRQPMKPRSLKRKRCHPRGIR